MDPLAALAAGRTPVDATLATHPLGWMRAPPGWDTGRQAIDEHLLYLVDAGEISLETGGSTNDLGPGWLALIPPRTPFRARSGRTAPSFWRVRMRLPAPWDGPLALPGGRELEPVVALLVAEATGQAAHRAESIRGLALVLLAGLRRLAAGDPARRLTTAQRALLERHAAEQPQATPRDLARVLGLTLDYCTRLVRATYGRPPRRWLLERRMHAAAERVAAGDEPIAAIAAACGQDDPRIFGRQFRQVLGQSPGRFRASVRDGVRTRS